MKTQAAARSHTIQGSQESDSSRGQSQSSAQAGDFAATLRQKAVREKEQREHDQRGGDDRPVDRASRSCANERGKHGQDMAFALSTIAELRALNPVRPAEKSVAVGPAADVEAMAQQMLRAVSVSQVDGISTVRLELSTDALEGVRLDLSLEGGALRARFDVADAASYRLLNSAAGDLRETLTQKGLQVDEIEVHQHDGGSHANRDRPRDEQQGEQAEQRRKRGPVDGVDGVGRRRPMPSRFSL